MSDIPYAEAIRLISDNCTRTGCTDRSRELGLEFAGQLDDAGVTSGEAVMAVTTLVLSLCQNSPDPQVQLDSFYFMVKRALEPVLAKEDLS